MAPVPDVRRAWLNAGGVALRNIILFIAVLAIPLAAAQDLGLSSSQTTNWIMVVYGLSGIFSLILSLVYRQPLLMTGNLFALIFIASLGDEFSFAEIIGAYIVAGLGILFISFLGLTGRLANILPAPIVFGLLAGALLPFVARIFNFLGEEPILIGGTFLAYLLGQRFLGNRIPAIVPALIAGLIIAALSGQLGQLQAGLALTTPQITVPDFSLQAIITISPVILILIIVQSNLPSIVFIKDQGYQPAERAVDLISGLGTIFGSLLGPIAVSLSLPATSLVAGPEAGQRQFRYLSVVLVAVGAILIGLLASLAAVIPEIIPASLLLTLAGLAVVGVLVNALQQVVRGPLILGPAFAFTVASSQIVWLGFGPFFWALVIGSLVSFLLEREKMRSLQVKAL
jgi:benzoate membrane transport protein